MNKVRRSVRLALLAIPLSFLIPGSAEAQQGGIAGTVRDTATLSPLGAVAVTVIDGTTVVAGVVSGPSGTFRVSDLPPGTYTVRFTSPGWRTLTLTGVTVTAGQLTSLSVSMEEQSYQLNPIQVTASKTVEKVLDAPAAVEVVQTRDIDERPATTTVEHVKNKAGVDVINTGVQSSYVVVRGFNNIFSGASLTLTDNRIARVPSLRTNISHLNPITNLDLDRVEVVLGPGSALYGPNAANGVIHSLTKSPIDYPGASLSIAGGLRQQSSVDNPADISGGLPFEGNDEGIFHGEGRIAVAPSEKFGFKVSGQYFKGTEFLFNDETEVTQQAFADTCISSGYNLTNPACLNFAPGLNLTNPSDQALLRQSVDNVAEGRNNDLERWTLDGRVDIRPAPDVDIVLAGGRTNAVSSVDLTGLGAGQVVNWAYNYAQARINYGGLFVQGFWNRSDNDETFLLRSGRPLIDKSQLFVGQIQHQFRIGEDHRVIYGADLLRTLPDTEGTINGQNEDDDDITEVGGYAQWEWALDPKLDFVAAARLDDHSRLEDPVFSPRAALVFKPDPAHTLRATFNRAFSTPTSLNLYLDISGGTLPLGGPFQYDIRATGSTDLGHMFMRDANGTPMHMSPFAPLLGASKRDFLPTTTAQLWAEAVAIVSAQNPAVAPLFGLVQVPTEAQVSVLPLTFDPSQVGESPSASCPAPPFCLLPGGLAGLEDIAQLDPTITNTLEVGYKGLVGDGRVLLGVNAWWSHITDFVSALRVSTPNVFLNGQEIGAYLTQSFLPLVGIAFPDAATAQATAAQLAGAMGVIPLGVVTTQSVGGTEPALALVYRNLGSVDVFGGELAANIAVGESWELAGALSVVDKDEFTTEGENPEVVPLNAPTVKGTASILYRNDDAGFNGQIRFRAQNGFDANSGVYIGPVDGFAIVDVGVGWRLPGFDGVRLQLDVQNVFDNGYQSFVGTPVLGRFGILRLRYDFNPL